MPIIIPQIERTEISKPVQIPEQSQIRGISADIPDLTLKKTEETGLKILAEKAEEAYQYANKLRAMEEIDKYNRFESSLLYGENGALNKFLDDAVKDGGITKKSLEEFDKYYEKVIDSLPNNDLRIMVGSYLIKQRESLSNVLNKHEAAQWKAKEINVHTSLIKSYEDKGISALGNEETLNSMITEIIAQINAFGSKFGQDHNTIGKAILDSTTRMIVGNINNLIANNKPDIAEKIYNKYMHYIDPSIRDDVLIRIDNALVNSKAIKLYEDAIEAAKKPNGAIDLSIGMRMILKEQNVNIRNLAKTMFTTEANIANSEVKKQQDIEIGTIWRDLSLYLSGQKGGKSLHEIMKTEAWANLNANNPQEAAKILMWFNSKIEADRREARVEARYQKWEEEKRQTEQYLLEFAILTSPENIEKALSTPRDFYFTKLPDWGAKNLANWLKYYDEYNKDKISATQISKIIKEEAAKSGMKVYDPQNMTEKDKMAFAAIENKVMEAIAAARKKGINVDSDYIRKITNESLGGVKKSWLRKWVESDDIFAPTFLRPLYDLADLVLESVGLQEKPMTKETTKGLPDKNKRVIGKEYIINGRRAKWNGKEWELIE